MDTSEKYIKMCEKVPFPMYIKVGDYIYNYDTKRVETVTDLEQIIEMKLNPTKLYRQDQLQEIIDKIDVGSDAYVVQMVFQDWFDDFNPDEWDFSWSMEMLWLAFVMEYKYQKIWNNEKEEWMER